MAGARMLAVAAVLASASPAHAGTTTADPLSDYVRTRLAAAGGDSARAVSGYSEALALRPDDVGLALRAYDEALLSGDWNLTLRAARRLQALAAAPAEIPVLFMTDALDRGDPATAATRIADLSAGALDFLAPSLRAWLAVWTGEVPALDAAPAGAALAKSYLDGEASALTTAAARRRGRVEAADAGIARLLVRFARDARSLDAPIDLPVLRAAMRLDPESADAAVLLAVRLDEAGRTDAAVAGLADLDADRARANEMATALLLRANRPDDALGVATRAAERRGAGWEERLRLAEVQASTDRASDAAAGFGRLLTDRRVDPAERYRLLLGRGSALAEAGDWASAEPVLRAAAAAAPDDPSVLNNVGYALLENGKVADGAMLIERAATLAPDDPAIIDSLGWARHRAGDSAGALVHLERAAALSPADTDVNEHLGDVLWALGRRREARFAWAAAAVEADATAAARISAKIAAGPTG
ncbi:Flp pilus assembly protein TadD [Sphingomonas jejuensis]|uniref:Flp pilus assembly protein TadD n=1 Tax=Sphingomonas jejuensis TaxID=904715 RepID=A0ABX0XJX6_9SPHN|nr:tetratricopeptide repeat protein [Sphingomonas jejuensis]NJC33644.1 Flp pilus assembly protein TadD [Sphingomonas jejuensis]